MACIAATSARARCHVPTQVSPSELPPPSNAGPFRFHYALLDAYANAVAAVDGPVGSWR